MNVFIFVNIEADSITLRSLYKNIRKDVLPWSIIHEEEIFSTIRKKVDSETAKNIIYSMQIIFQCVYPEILELIILVNLNNKIT